MYHPLNFELFEGKELKLSRLKCLVAAIGLTANFAFADYADDVTGNWFKSYSLGAIYYRPVTDEINHAWRRGVVIAKQGMVIEKSVAYEVAYKRINRIVDPALLGNDAILSLVDLWVNALNDGWKYASEGSGNVDNEPAQASNDSLTFSCNVNVSYQGQRTPYMDQKGAWGQVINDYGSYFSWDLPRGNRGNSTGQDAFSGMDEKSPDLTKVLQRTTVESDGSQVDELRTDVMYGGSEPSHKFVYARRIKPNGIREYYVTDLTDKRAFMFLNCQ